MKILKLPPEKWETVPRLPFMLDGEFELSNHGRVRRIKTGKIILGGRRASNEGWKTAHLTVERKRTADEPRKVISSKRITIHRMVWELFGNRPLLPNEHLYHINKCQDDNYIWNLAPTNKRCHKRRVARFKREGKYYHKRGRRYFHDRKR